MLFNHFMRLIILLLMFNLVSLAVQAADIISTVVSTETGGYGGDNGLATMAKLSHPSGVALDSHGNLFIADRDNHRIRKVDTMGIITTVAGTGVQGYGGDNDLATAAKLDSPSGIALDRNGNLFIADTNNHRIRKVDTASIITTVAGTGVQGYSGDYSVAIAARLNKPNSIVLDQRGNLFIADTGNRCIRKVDTGGIITTVVGSKVLE